jgi:hypothetical protein
VSDHLAAQWHVRRLEQENAVLKKEALWWRVSSSGGLSKVWLWLKV